MDRDHFTKVLTEVEQLLELQQSELQIEKERNMRGKEHTETKATRRKIPRPKRLEDHAGDEYADDLLRKRKSLPAFQMRQKILEAIESHQVGKTFGDWMVIAIGQMRKKFTESLS